MFCRELQKIWRRQKEDMKAQLPNIHIKTSKLQDMRKLLLLLSFASFVLSCSNNKDAKEKVATKDTPKKSIPSTVSKSVGGANIRITYHSPAVRGRVIWGGLVPFDAVWV